RRLSRRRAVFTPPKPPPSIKIRLRSVIVGSAHQRARCDYFFSILSVAILSPFILSDSILSPVILSDSILSPFILSASILSILPVSILSDDLAGVLLHPTTARLRLRPAMRTPA